MSNHKIVVNKVVITLLAIVLLRVSGDTAPSPQIRKAQAWQQRAYLCADDRIKARHLIIQGINALETFAVARGFEKAYREKPDDFTRRSNFILATAELVAEGFPVTGSAVTLPVNPAVGPLYKEAIAALKPYLSTRSSYLVVKKTVLDADLLVADHDLKVVTGITPGNNHNENNAERAVAADPTFAQAWFCLAQTCAENDPGPYDAMRPKYVAYLNRATSLDAGLKPEALIMEALYAGRDRHLQHNLLAQAFRLFPEYPYRNAICTNFFYPDLKQLPASPAMPNEVVFDDDRYNDNGGAVFLSKLTDQVMAFRTWTKTVYATDLKRAPFGMKHKLADSWEVPWTLNRTIGATPVVPWSATSDYRLVTDPEAGGHLAPIYRDIIKFTENASFIDWREIDPVNTTVLSSGDNLHFFQIYSRPDVLIVTKDYTPYEPAGRYFLGINPVTGEDSVQRLRMRVPMGGIMSVVVVLPYFEPGKQNVKFLTPAQFTTEIEDHQNDPLNAPDLRKVDQIADWSIARTRSGGNH